MLTQIMIWALSYSDMRLAVADEFNHRYYDEANGLYVYTLRALLMQMQI